jgi:hypothetical protein
MTDQANIVAADAGTTTAADAAAGTNGAQTAVATDIFASLQDAESRQWVESKGYKELGPVISDARYADKLKAELGDLKAKALTLPGDDAKPEDIDAFFQKLGMPEKAEGYDFKMPEGLPADLPYDADFAKEFKAAAREARVPAKQAQALHDFYVKTFAAKMQAGAEAQAKAKAEAEKLAHAELSQTWGAPDSDTHKEKIGFVARALEGAGIKDEAVRMGIMDEQGFTAYPKMAQFLALAGERLFREGTHHVGGMSFSGNPYAKGSENLTQQMLLFKQDPNKARALMAAAGRPPTDFGLPAS